MPIHLRSPAYDVPGFLAGGLALDEYDVRAVGDLRGRSLLHLQCHLGLETLSWARLGAQVTGLDFSPAALAAARWLATEAGLAATFVEANVLEAPRALRGRRFDVVYASTETLAWVPSVSAWCAAAAACLAPNGVLFLRDVHPALHAAAEDSPPGRLYIVDEYFEPSVPTPVERPTTYASHGGAQPLAHPRTYQWNRSLGEVVSAVLAVGLILEGLEELDWVDWPALPWLEREGKRWRPPAGSPRLPLSFALRARRPPASAPAGRGG